MWFDIRIILTYRDALGIGKGLLKPGGKFIETHLESLIGVDMRVRRLDWATSRGFQHAVAVMVVSAQRHCRAAGKLADGTPVLIPQYHADI